MREKAPAFQFYPSDFVSDINVVMMNMEQRGQYITLLCYDWKSDGLPNDESVLSALCNGNAIAMQVLNCFELCDDNKLRNPRLSREREKQASRRKKMSDNAKSRWTKEKQSKQKHSKSNAIALQKQCSSSSSSSSPSNNTPIVPKGSGYTQEFDSFWAKYPKKDGKLAAFKAYQKAKKRATAEQIVEGLLVSPQLQRDTQYIPCCSKWLNGNGWEDEPARRQRNIPNADD